MNNIIKTHIVQTGSSYAVLLPELLLEQMGISGEVEVAVDHLILRRARRPREGWEEQYKQMAKDGADTLLDAESLTPTQWDLTEWEW